MGTQPSKARELCLSPDVDSHTRSTWRTWTSTTDCCRLYEHKRNVDHGARSIASAFHLTDHGNPLGTRTRIETTKFAFDIHLSKVEIHFHPLQFVFDHTSNCSIIGILHRITRRRSIVYNMGHPICLRDRINNVCDGTRYVNRTIRSYENPGDVTRLFNVGRPRTIVADDSRDDDFLASLWHADEWNDSCAVCEWI